MGWTFFHKPVGVSATEAIKRELGDNWCAKHVVAATATYEAVFIVVERHDPESAVYVPDADGNTRELGVIKVRNNPRARDGYNFGYKDMTETMGPYGCEAPLSILAKCSELRPLIGDAEGSLKSAIEYRARCARIAAAKAFKRSLKPGDKITLRKPMKFGGRELTDFTVERGRVRGRKGMSTYFRAVETGAACLISARDLESAAFAAVNTKEEAVS